MDREELISLLTKLQTSLSKTEIKTEEKVLKDIQLQEEYKVKVDSYKSELDSLYSDIQKLNEETAKKNEFVDSPEKDTRTREELLSEISYLKTQIAELESKVNALKIKYEETLENYKKVSKSVKKSVNSEILSNEIEKIIIKVKSGKMSLQEVRKKLQNYLDIELKNYESEELISIEKSITSIKEEITTTKDIIEIVKQEEIDSDQKDIEINEYKEHIAILEQQLNELNTQKNNVNISIKNEIAIIINEISDKKFNKTNNVTVNNVVINNTPKVNTPTVTPVQANLYPKYDQLKNQKFWGPLSEEEIDDAIQRDFYEYEPGEQQFDQFLSEHSYNPTQLKQEYDNYYKALNYLKWGPLTEVEIDDAIQLGFNEYDPLDQGSFEQFLTDHGYNLKKLQDEYLKNLAIVLNKGKDGPLPKLNPQPTPTPTPTPTPQPEPDPIPPMPYPAPPIPTPQPEPRHLTDAERKANLKNILKNEKMDGDALDRLEETGVYIPSKIYTGVSNNKIESEFDTMFGHDVEIAKAAEEAARIKEEDEKRKAKMEKYNALKELLEKMSPFKSKATTIDPNEPSMTM